MLARQYNSGELDSVWAVAGQYNHPFSTAHNLLHDGGARFRPPGGPQRMK
jgi:hypothetical protein